MPAKRGVVPLLTIDVPFGAEGYYERKVNISASGARLSLRSFGWEDANPQLGVSGLVTVKVSVVDSAGDEDILDRFTPPPMLIPGGGLVPDVCTGNAPLSKNYDLSKYEGQTVRLRLGATSLNCCGTLALFDDVVLNYAVVLIPASPASTIGVLVVAVIVVLFIVLGIWLRDFSRSTVERTTHDKESARLRRWATRLHVR